MPLPRERSTYDLRGASSIVPGTGFAAQAEAENQIARSLNGIGDMLYKDAAAGMAQKGREQALADPMRRGALEYEQFTKNPDGSVTRQVVRDDTGKILPPESSPYSLSFYDQAYHKTAIERYQIDVGNAARAKAAELAQRFPNNPQEFSAAWSAYRDAQLKNLSVPVMGPAAVTLEDVGQQHFRAIVSARGAMDYKAALQAHAADASRNERDAVNMVMQGRPVTDPEVQRSVRAYFDRLDQGAGNLGYYSKASADEEKRKFVGQLAFAELMSTANKAQNARPAKPVMVGETDEEKATREQIRQIELQNPTLTPADKSAMMRRWAAEDKERANLPRNVEKPPDQKAYLDTRQQIAAFLRGDAVMTVIERDPKGNWVAVQKKASDILSPEERKEIASKGTTVVEYTEATREKMDAWVQKIQAQQALYDRFDAIMQSRDTGTVDVRRLTDQSLRLAQQGRPDLAISQFSFMRGLEDHIRTEQDRVARNEAASALNLDLVKRLAAWEQGGAQSVWSTMSREQQAAVLKGNPTIANEVLRYSLAQLEAAERAQKIPKAQQEIIDAMLFQQQRDAAARKEGTPTRIGDGANLEQTDDRAKAADALLRRGAPSWVPGVDPKADAAIVQQAVQKMGVIPYSVRDYMASAFSGSDPAKLRAAVGLGNLLADMPNIGLGKLRKLLGENSYDAYMHARQVAQRGGFVEGEVANIQKLNAGQPLGSINAEAMKTYLESADTYLQRYIQGDRRWNLGVLSVGPHMVPIPAEMHADFRAEVKRLAGGRSASDAAEIAFQNIKERWSLSRFNYHPALSFDAQMGPVGQAAAFVTGGAFTPERKAWTDRAVERLYPKLSEQDIVRSAKAQLTSQLQIGKQFKTFEDIELGKNAWLTNPHVDEATGKRYWNVVVTGTTGAHTTLFAKPGTSRSGYVEVTFDEEAGRASREALKEARRDAAVEAEGRILDQKAWRLQQESMRRRATGERSSEYGPGMRKLYDDYQRKVGDIRGPRFNPDDYGMGY